MLQAEKPRRGQIRYLLVVFCVAHFGGGMNWLPWFGIYWPPYSNLLVTVYVSLVAYAVLKHRFLDINVVIQKTLIYSLVTAGLTTLYVLTVLILTRLFEGWIGTLSYGIIAAGVVTMIFHPFLNKVQSTISDL